MSDEPEYHITYTLSPLPLGHWTRVLILDPGESDDPITTNLHLHNLDESESDTEPYEAISYVWGDSTKRRSIRVNGHFMDITNNLFVALQQLRSRDVPRRLWADAVCINQSNYQEKGKQVNTMGTIYSQAARVIVWVGSDEEGVAEPAISVIKKFNRLVEAQVTPQQFYSGWGPLNDPDCTVKTDDLKHVQTLFKLPWFTRVWVMQEVGVSKEVLFAWGTAKADFVEIVQFICSWGTSYLRGQFPGIKFPSNYLASMFTYIWASYIPREIETFDMVWFKNSSLLRYEARTMRNTRALEFEDIIFRCRHQLRATNPRDFVYAFLAHPTATTADGQPIINADYTITMEELRLRLFSTISRRSLRFLGLLQYTHINWRYDASKNLSDFQDISTPITTNSSLQTSALLIDEIHLCGEVTGPIEKDLELSDHDFNALRPIVHEVIERYWSLAEELNAHYTSAYPDRLMAFASTLIAAIEDEKQRVIAKQFEKFCRDHCSSISEHIPNNWLDKWGPSQPGDPYFPFRERSASTIMSERFFTTVKGYYGMGAPLVQPGDLICIFPTAQTPLVIRRVEGEESTYHVICACYLYGMMFGDAVRKWSEDPSSIQKADIILI